jgi:beta-lactamase regulating signal transducer with metallopeptidase domain
MFVVRGIAVCLSVFSLVYLTLSSSMWVLQQRILTYGQRLRPHRAADLQFGLRMLPLTAASVITLGFAAPSFLQLEPRAINEPLGAIPLGLAMFGFVLIVVGVGSAVRALKRASHAVSRWREGAEVQSSGSVLLLRVVHELPSPVAAGVFRPRVLVSREIESVLTPKELQIALQHELAHVRRRDNLKKLLLLLAVFPGMRELEASWREASEIAADDAAVSNASQALDLAAALIKLSRVAPLQPPAELTTALTHSPAESVNARVERLLAWNGGPPSPVHGVTSWYSVATAMLGLLAIAMTYSQLLAFVHAATEWLVR